MATYNRAAYILESIHSIKSQTFIDWECMIIDDGGTDNTKEAIGPILKEDSRFHYYIRPSKYQKGLPGTRNYGLDLAKGEYIIFFDDDDIVHPQNLEICVSEFQKHTISFCRYVRAVFVNDFNYHFDYSKDYSYFEIDVKDIYNMLNNTLAFNSCAVMWKKECFENHRFNEHLMYAEEWELYSRIVSSGFSGISITKTLFYGRKHLASNTGEFYQKAPIRRSSNAEAIYLVAQNLKEKNLLSYPILRYFVQVALEYKEFKLFERIINTLDLSTFEQMKWRLFYVHLPIRLYLYRILRK